MNQLIIGLTGGIGTGKTAVSNRFKALGITIADADEAARAVVQAGSKLLEDIAAHFGQRILTETGELDRPQLRSIIFADGNARRFLERATHGPIMDHLRLQLASATSPYAILVLSAGTGQNPLINRMLVVDAPVELQQRRVLARDGSSLETINQIIKAQPARLKRLALADDIIENIGSEQALDDEVAALHQFYLDLIHHD
ncbi:MAG: dephospho-CoA kinase [Pseudomonadales bacterium]|jgi:dephospho-CoA kinase|tara:strand:- start:696 stop:1295 length:600 start_codon:yes stop_codon:yes gene_type:complete